MPIARQAFRARTVRPTMLKSIAVLTVTWCCLSGGMLQAQKNDPLEAPQDKQNAKADPGLRGMLPELSPDLLSLDEFDKLGEAWAEWSEETGGALAEIYGDPELNRTQQEERISFLKERSAQLKTDTSFSTDKDVKAVAASLAHRIDRRIALLEAALATVPRGAKDADKARAAVKNFVVAFEEYEKDGTVAAAKEVRAALDGLTKATPDKGQALKAFFHPRFFNYNMHIVGTEDVLSRFVNETDRQVRPVRDRAFGANIFGTSTTDTRVVFDMKPSTNGVNASILLTGITQTNTVGVVPQAKVYTRGYHRFWANKPLNFDGKAFVSGPATVSIDPNNTTVGAKTNISWIPIFGSIANGIAIKEARKRKFQGEALAAGKLRDEILPEFNREVGGAVVDGNTAISSLNERLKAKNLYPAAVHASSSENAFRYASQVRGGQELAGDVAPPIVPVPGGISVAIHQSLLNNSLNQFDLAGQELSQDELGEHLKKQIESLMPADDAPSVVVEDTEQADADDSLIFRFDKTDPIRVRIDEGKIFLTIRAAFIVTDEETGEKTEVPPRLVEMTMVPRLQDGKFIIETVKRRVSRVKGADPALAQTRVITKRLNDQGVEVQSFDSSFPLKRDGKPDFVFNIVNIKAQNGWMTIDVQ